MLKIGKLKFNVCFVMVEVKQKLVHANITMDDTFLVAVVDCQKHIVKQTLSMLFLHFLFREIENSPEIIYHWFFNQNQMIVVFVRVQQSYDVVTMKMR